LTTCIAFRSEGMNLVEGCFAVFIEGVVGSNDLNQVVMTIA
jgi:hypothetical protein